MTIIPVSQWLACLALSTVLATGSAGDMISVERPLPSSVQAGSWYAQGHHCRAYALPTMAVVIDNTTIHPMDYPRLRTDKEATCGHAMVGWRVFVDYRYLPVGDHVLTLYAGGWEVESVAFEIDHHPNYYATEELRGTWAFYRDSDGVLIAAVRLEGDTTLTNEAAPLWVLSDGVSAGAYVSPARQYWIQTRSETTGSRLCFTFTDPDDVAGTYDFGDSGCSHASGFPMHGGRTN